MRCRSERVKSSATVHMHPLLFCPASELSLLHLSAPHHANTHKHTHTFTYTHPHRFTMQSRQPSRASSVTIPKQSREVLEGHQGPSLRPNKHLLQAHNCHLHATSFIPAQHMKFSLWLPVNLLSLLMEALLGCGSVIPSQASD